MNQSTRPSYPHSLRRVPQALAAVAMGAALQLVPAFVSAQTNHTIGPTPGFFSDQYVGTDSLPQTLTIDYTNLGPGLMTIDSIVTSGPFRYITTCPLPPAGLSAVAYGGPPTSCSVDVWYRPIMVGTNQPGALVVTTSDGPPDTFSLMGDAIAMPMAIADLTPSSLDFGTQPLLTQSASQTVVLTNVGTDYFRIESVTSDDPLEFPVTPLPDNTDLAPPPDQPKGSPERSGNGNNPTAAGQGRIEVALAPKNAKVASGVCETGYTYYNPGESCTFDVAFVPYSPGRKSSVITLIARDSSDFLVLGASSLLATGIGAGGNTIDARPSSIDFGDVILNQTSGPKTFSISSTGTNSITISDISVGPTSGKSAIARKVLTDFTLQHDCTTLAPSSSCTGKVSFKPSAIGARNASVIIKGDFEGSPLSIALEGNGLPAPVPGLTLSVSGIGFGQRGYGDQSSTQSITLTSSGVLPVTIASIYTLGDFFRTSTCPAVLNPGQSCNVTVGFNPSLFGTRNGELVVVSNAPDSPQSVQLQGTGCTPTFGASFLSLRRGIPVCPH